MRYETEPAVVDGADTRTSIKSTDTPHRVENTGTPQTPSIAMATRPLRRRKRHSRRARRMRRILRLAVFVLALLGLLAVIIPVRPNVGGYLAAAAAARAGLRYDRALAFYAAASAESPADPRPYCATGEVRALQQEWPDAIAAYRSCIARATADAQEGIKGWLGLGNALSASGDDVRAEDAWRHAAAGGEHEAWRRLGLLYEQQSRFDEAQHAWTALPEDDPQAREHLGLLALGRGDYARARADFVAARAQPNAYADEVVDNGILVLAARPPQDAAGFSLLGYRFLSIGQPGLAQAPLRAALALDPGNGQAHAYLGWALWIAHQQSAGRQEIATGLRLAPSLSFAWYATGQVALADDDARRAGDAFAHAAALDPNNPVIWAASGRLAIAQHDYLLGELALERAAELSHDPADTIALLQLYADRGLHIQTTDRARQAALEALKRFPDDEAVRYLLATVYDEIGQPSFAYYAAQEAIALDPTDPGPYVLLGRYAFDDGNYVTAALDLRLALALRPHGPLADEARAILAPIKDIAV